MLPSRTRGRYSIFILFSLLVHITFVAALLWTSPNEEEQVKKDKTVTINLKQKEEPKKQEAKKQEAKKQEAKKQEAKKQEAKKQEAKKQEAKKQEAKKQEAKKQEAKKQEAKKQEAKKQEAKKQEAEKQEAKKSEPRYNPYQSSLDLLQQQENKKSESLRAEQALPKFGSMTMLDDRELKKSVIYTKGYGNKFQKREYDGQRIKKSLSKYERQKLNQHLADQVDYIFSSFDAPKKDGKSYYGEISILLDENGLISDVTMKSPSGNTQLDEAVFKTVIRAKRLSLPADPLIRKAMVTSPLTLNYSDEDMAD